MQSRMAEEDGSARPAAFAGKAPLGWGLALAQIASVAAIYLFASILPVLPAIVTHALSGAEGQPQIGSAATAATVMASMAAALLLAWLWLRREGRVAQAFDLSPPDWRKALAWALFGTGGVIAIFAVGTPLVQALGLPAPDPAFVLALVTESPAMFVLWVVGVAILAAGFGEELLWRGFLMDRLERLAGLRGRTWLVLAVQAVLFGLPHAYQGAGGVIVTGMVGLLLGWIRIRQRGNLWAVMIAHAAVDVIMMSLAYAAALGLLD